MLIYVTLDSVYKVSNMCIVQSKLPFEITETTCVSFFSNTEIGKVITCLRSQQLCLSVFSFAHTSAYLWNFMTDQLFPRLFDPYKSLI